MEEVKKALENIKTGIEALQKHCDESSCQGCVLKGDLCNSMIFENITKSIEEWEGR
jgi:hypothetical protein